MIRRLLGWLRAGLRRRVRDETGLAGTLTIKEYDKTEIPRYESIPSKRDRYNVVREWSPDTVTETTNIVQDEFLKYLVDVSLPGSGQSRETISHFSVGTDGTAPTGGDGGLLNEVLRTSLQSETDNGKDFEATGFLDSTEANGNTLVETALETSSSGDHTVNRALISDIAKTDKKLVTIDFTIEFRAA